MAQTEEVAEENKSLIMHLLKQVRPGMDLSKVVLPTFILEPRSFLEKLSDYYHHCDILEEWVGVDMFADAYPSVLQSGQLARSVDTDENHREILSIRILQEAEGNNPASHFSDSCLVV